VLDLDPWQLICEHNQVWALAQLTRYNNEQSLEMKEGVPKQLMLQPLALVKVMEAVVGNR
jgi:hypothetical protein